MRRERECKGERKDGKGAGREVREARSTKTGVAPSINHKGVLALSFFLRYFC